MQPNRKRNARDKGKPDLSTIEGSRQFILQYDKKKKKKTDGVSSTNEPLQSQTNDSTLTAYYRDRAQERRERTASNDYEEDEIIDAGDKSRDSMKFSPFVKGLDYSLLKRDTQETLHIDTEKTPNERGLEKKELTDLSFNDNWPSSVAKVAVLSFRKGENTSQLKRHRVDSFYPGVMYYVYELHKQGLNENDQPLVVRHSKKHISPSTSIIYEWNYDIASMIWREDKKLSPTQELTSYSEANSEIYLNWNCKKPCPRHDVLSSVDNNETAIDNESFKKSAEYPASTTMTSLTQVKEERAEEIPCSLNENDVQEEDFDIFQDIDPSQVTWSYSKI